MMSLVVTGAHPLMQKIRSLASRLATCDTPALILGEPGTAKRDLACHIHQQSRRARGPFVSVNAACMSADGFTEVLQKTHDGTLLLANVDALDRGLVPVVSKLLDGMRSLRGSPSGANVRLIASVEPDLSPAASGSDLLERFRRVSLFLPPLRERRSDIPLLIRYLLDKYASENDGPARRMPDDTMVFLWQYDWPGNLRELAEVVQQSARAATDGSIRPSLLPAYICHSFRSGTAVDRYGRAARNPSVTSLGNDDCDSFLLR